MSFLLNPSLSRKFFVPCPKLLWRIIGFSWDLKSGYHHVGIYPDHQKHVSFSWLFNGTPRHFTFSVLPFGLSTAGFCFAKLMRPLVKQWMSMGQVSFVYLDDGFASQPGRLFLPCLRVPFSKRTLNLLVCNVTKRNIIGLRCEFF